MRGPDKINSRTCVCASISRFAISAVHGSSFRAASSQVAVEDADGRPVLHIKRGPRAGESILSQSEFSVPLGSDGTLIVNNIRIREVARNHGSREFQLVLSLPEYALASVRTRLFELRSDRLRSPSYTNTLASARAERKLKSEHFLPDTLDAAAAATLSDDVCDSSSVFCLCWDSVLFCLFCFCAISCFKTNFSSLYLFVCCL